MRCFAKLSGVGILNSLLCTIALLIVISSNYQLLSYLDINSSSTPEQPHFAMNYFTSTSSVHTILDDVEIDETDETNVHPRMLHGNQDQSQLSYMSINLYLSSLTKSSEQSMQIFKHYSQSQSRSQDFVDCIVYLSTPETINGTIGSIYNMREPSLGNWTHCIIVIGYKLNLISSPHLYYVHKYFQCLNVFHLDVTHDAIITKMPFSLHVHFWKCLILLHPFFRRPRRIMEMEDANAINLDLKYSAKKSKSKPSQSQTQSEARHSNINWRYIMYLDSDVITVRPIQQLMDRSVEYMKTGMESDIGQHRFPNHLNLQFDDIWVAWREDYRHGSMYTAVLNGQRLQEQQHQQLFTELKHEYPDYKESKQGNVMLFNMQFLPSVTYLYAEIERIYEKYGIVFKRNDQSLFNLLLYYHSVDLGWSAFTHPPSEDLFYPPNDNWPMVHTGGHEAMYLRRPIKNRGGIERASEKAWYHALWEFWWFKLHTECPEISMPSAN